MSLALIREQGSLLVRLFDNFPAMQGTKATKTATTSLLLFTFDNFHQLRCFNSSCCVADGRGKLLTEFIGYFLSYAVLYNNRINARDLIGQSAMVYFTSKPMENSRVLRIII